MNAAERSQNQFVFVVCGAREHIDTLHFSLNALRHYSRNDILVVTDTTRNEIPVVWDLLVDVRTPEDFNHHQASIYLKTSLHRILPPGPTYCYLDTDVVALSPEADSVFAYRNGPITFAPDQGRLHQFSPYAIRCGCAEHYQTDYKEVTDLVTRFKETLSASRMTVPSPSQHERQPRTLLHRLRAVLTSRSQAETVGFKTPILQAQATEAPSAPFDWDELVKAMEAQTEWRFNLETQSWINSEGRDGYFLRCNHLAGQIEAKFGIQIQDPHWQHWNGGVFLFDAHSHAFLEAWHQKTMAIFADPMWRTRDQGTLIATVWEFGLQQATLLPRLFNFIIDHNWPGLALTEDRTRITNDGFATTCRPALAHVFYRFGETNWDIWNWIEERSAPDSNRSLT